MGETFWEIRDEVVAHEQAVLRAMAYDTEPTSAYIFLTELCWLLKCGHGIASLAWTLLNDAFCSEICAVAPAARVAMACILLAVQLGRRVPEIREDAERVAKHVDHLSKEPCLDEFLGIAS